MGVRSIRKEPDAPSEPLPARGGDETLVGGDDARIVVQSKGEINTIVNRMACLRREL